MPRRHRGSIGPPYFVELGKVLIKPVLYAGKVFDLVNQKLTCIPDNIAARMEMSACSTLNIL